MDIVVCVKTNPDLQMVRFRNREPVLEAVPYKVGDLEKNALEAAVQLRDAAGGKVIALTVAEGNRKIKETMKEALAMGPTRRSSWPIRPWRAPTRPASPWPWPRLVQKIGGCDLLLFGEGSTDGYSGPGGSADRRDSLGVAADRLRPQAAARPTAASRWSAAWTTSSRP